jgi:hypothetical protein
MRLECDTTPRELVVILLQAVCMAMIATISWANYETSDKLNRVVRDIQTRQIVGSGADYVSLECFPEISEVRHEQP